MVRHLAKSRATRDISCFEGTYFSFLFNCFFHFGSYCCPATEHTESAFKKEHIDILFHGCFLTALVCFWETTNTYVQEYVPYRFVWLCAARARQTLVFIKVIAGRHIYFWLPFCLTSPVPRPRIPFSFLCHANCTMAQSCTARIAWAVVCACCQCQKATRERQICLPHGSLLMHLFFPFSVLYFFWPRESWYIPSHGSYGPHEFENTHIIARVAANPATASILLALHPPTCHTHTQQPQRVHVLLLLPRNDVLLYI